MEAEISKVFSLTKQIGKQPFRDIFSQSCGYRIIPVDIKKASDKKIIEFVAHAMNNFLASSKKSGTRYKGNRANDVGKKMETGIIEELKKTPLAGC